MSKRPRRALGSAEIGPPNNDSDAATQPRAGLRASPLRSHVAFPRSLPTYASRTRRLRSAIGSATSLAMRRILTTLWMLALPCSSPVRWTAPGAEAADSPLRRATGSGARTTNRTSTVGWPGTPTGGGASRRHFAHGAMHGSMHLARQRKAAETGSYADDRREGTWEAWYQDGPGAPSGVRHGQRHGSNREWYPNVSFARGTVPDGVVTDGDRVLRERAETIRGRIRSGRVRRRVDGLVRRWDPAQGGGLRPRHQDRGEAVSARSMSGQRRRRRRRVGFSWRSSSSPTVSMPCARARPNSSIQTRSVAWHRERAVTRVVGNSEFRAPHGRGRSDRVAAKAAGHRCVHNTATAGARPH